MSDICLQNVPISAPQIADFASSYYTFFSKSNSSPDSRSTRRGCDDESINPSRSVQAWAVVAVSAAASVRVSLAISPIPLLRHRSDLADMGDIDPRVVLMHIDVCVIF